jgi:ankyrin repeat protein
MISETKSQQGAAMSRLLYSLIFAAILAGCSSGPDLVPPAEDDTLSSDSEMPAESEPDEQPPVDYSVAELPSAVDYDEGMRLEFVAVESVVSREHSDVSFSVRLRNLRPHMISRIAFTAAIADGPDNSFSITNTLRPQEVRIEPGDEYVLDVDLGSELRSKNEEMFAFFDALGTDFSQGLDLHATIMYQKPDGSYHGYRTRSARLQVVPQGTLVLVGHESIHAAVADGNLEKVRERIAAGDDVNTVDVYRTPVLVSALLNGNAEIARALIDAGADPNAAGPTTGNALQAALQSGNLSLAEFILDRGGRYSPVEGFSGLQEAVLSGELGFAERLIDAGASIDEPGNLEVNGREQTLSLLQWATFQDDQDLIESLVELGASPSVTVNGGGMADMSPLRIAAEYGNDRLVGYYLSLGVDPDIRDRYAVTPLMAAAHYGDLESVRLLVEAGADVNADTLDDQNAIYGFFGEEPRPGIPLRTTQFFGASAFFWGYNALTFATYLGNEDVVQYLIDHGARLDTVYEWGEKQYSVLDVAVRSGHPEMVSIYENLGVERMLVD